MQKSKKIVLAFVAIALLLVAAYFGRWLYRYHFYNGYRDMLTSYAYEEGGAFSPLSDEEKLVPGMQLAAQNDNLKLYVNPETGEVAVADRRTGQVTYSNPPDADQDAVASGTNKSYLKSQLIVDYFNTSRTEGTLDSYSYCTSKEGQLSVEGIENGVRFLYVIGDLSNTTGLVPQYISQETLDGVLAKLPEDEASFVSKKYTESTVAENYKELLPSAAKGASQLRKLNKYFEQAGFTNEDYLREMENSGVEGAVPISFEIPLEYRLNEDSVDVSVPMGQVVENGGGAIFRIQLLRYFGAAGKDETGYMLVPNGSGSLIYFNNGKSSADNYSEYLYGVDPLAADYTVLENTESAKLALYGLFRETSAVFATIEDGASLAYVNAGVSGKINEYNYVYPTFVVRGNDKLSMFGTTGNEADIPIVEKHFYDANLTVKYTMLTEDHATYAGAANYYRKRLQDAGILTAKKDAGGDIKFYYDVLGGVDMTKFFLGSQYQGLYAMTTFSQAEEIANTLADIGITNQVMNFQGWMNRGYYHDVADKIKVPRSLGKKSGLESLDATLAEKGGKLYADVAFQKVTTVSKRYSENNETSRYYGGGYIAEFGLVNPATLRQTSGLGYEENHYYLVSPKFLPRYIEKFTKKIEKYGLSGISLRDLGNELHSDKKRTNEIHREMALDVVLDSLAKLRGTGKQLMLNGGNDYAFAYADDIINAPLRDNDYYIVDETVPFYGMVLHGSIDYAGAPINLNGSYDRADIVLNLIETGASPHFLFTWENSSAIKHTGLNRFCSTAFQNWKDDAYVIYDEVNAALKKVRDSAIVNHEIRSETLRVVTYENGVKIYVNTGEEDAVADNVTVPARGYQIGGEADA